MKVCVIGLGYIGLPTAALLCSRGFDVVGVDINKEAVEIINQGKIHIVEPSLDMFVSKAVADGKLVAQTSPDFADIFMICVPTPFHPGEGVPQPNVDYVVAATKAIAKYVKPGNSVILESTSPVGTTELVAKTLDSLGINTNDIHFAYCPERVLPGRIMEELVSNDRVVGGLRGRDGEVVAEFYKKFVEGNVLLTDAKTAEMCKLTENSFRDVNIAFANELSMICDGLGVNVWELINLANRHPRVNILQPGCGVGGHCIAVDPWFIVASDPANAKLIRAGREVNNHKAHWVVDKVVTACADSKVEQPKIGCLGLAFKPDIDDLRESPAVEIAQGLVDKGFKVLTVEPNIRSHDSFENVTLDKAISDCDVLVILVKHTHFVNQKQAILNSGKVVLDFCGLLN